MTFSRSGAFNNWTYDNVHINPNVKIEEKGGPSDHGSRYWTVNNNLSSQGSLDFDQCSTLSVGNTVTWSGGSVTLGASKINVGNDVNFDGVVLAINNRPVHGDHSFMTNSGGLNSSAGNITLKSSTVDLSMRSATQEVYVKAAQNLTLENSTTTSNGGTFSGDAVTIRGGTFAANSLTTQVTSQTGVTIEGGAAATVLSGAILNVAGGTGGLKIRNANTSLTSEGTTTITGNLVVEDNASLVVNAGTTETTSTSTTTISNDATLRFGNGTFATSEFAMNGGRVAVNDSAAGRFNLKADDLSFENGKVMVGNNATFNAASQNGVVTFGDTIVGDNGTIAVLSTATGGKSTGRLAGIINTAGTIQADFLTVLPNSLIKVESSKSGSIKTLDNSADLDLSNTHVDAEGSFTAASANGIVKLGETNISGSYQVQNGTTNANGIAELHGKVAFKGTSGKLVAESFTADENSGSSIELVNTTRDAGSIVGSIESTGNGELDLTNTTVRADYGNTLNVKATSGNVKFGELNIAGTVNAENDNAAVTDHATLAGLVTFKGEADGSGQLKAGHVVAEANVGISVEADKHGWINLANAGDKTADLSQARSLVVNSNSTLKIGNADGTAKLNLGAAEVASGGVLDLTTAEINHAADKSVLLKGGEVKVRSHNVKDNTATPVAALHVAATEGDSAITVTDADTADYQAMTLSISQGATLTLKNTGTNTLTYDGIGGSAASSNAGTLHLTGQNVTFSTGANYNGSGIVSFDNAQQANRTITTTKTSVEKVVGARGTFAMGGLDTATVPALTRADNIFFINGTEDVIGTDGTVTSNAFDLSSLLDAGVFTRISGEGVLKTNTAELNQNFKDKNIDIVVDYLRLNAPSITIGGNDGASKITAFKNVINVDNKLNTLKFAENGQLMVGTSAEANSSDLSNVKMIFNGGKLIVENPDPTGTITINNDRNDEAVADDDAKKLVVKSLHFDQALAEAGSLTIKSGAQVEVLNDHDIGTRNFDAHGNATQGLVTLAGVGAKLIVSAKDLLKGDGKGSYYAADEAGVIGGWGTLKITDFVAYAREEQNLGSADKPQLNLNQFVTLRNSLYDKGNAVTSDKPFNVLIQFDQDDVVGFFEKDGTINRSDPETKKWLDNGASASGSLVTGVKKDDKSTTDVPQEWGAAKNDADNSTLLIGKDPNSNRGTSENVTLNNAGAGTSGQGPNYFVRYDTTTPAKQDQLGNIGFIGDKATGTLVGGGVVGTISGSTTTDANGNPNTTTGEIGGNYDIVFKDSKAEPGKAPDPENKKGFASGTIYLPTKTDPTDPSKTLTGNVTADKADVVIRSENGSNGDLTSSNLIVKNDSSVKVTGKTDIDNLKLGNDSDANKAGSTNKVEFVGNSTVDKIIADGAKVSEPVGGANGKAEVTFNQTGPNTVGGIFVESNNDLKVTGKVDVAGPATVHGTLSTTPDVKLNGGLVVGSTTGAPAHANIQNGSLQSVAQVGGSLGKGFLYLGATQDTMESPNTIGKNWKDSETALTERLPGTSYTGIGYLDKNGYDISNATINIGNVTGGSRGTLTVGTGGALIVTDQALTAPVDGQWNYTAGMKGNIANEGGTVMIGDLNKIANKTTIKLAEGKVTGTPDAVWITKNPLYTLTLKDDGILYASFNSTASDAITGKVDKDLADIIKDQGNKDQNQGGGFDKDRKDGNGFISKVLDDTVTNDNGVDFDATADRIGKTLTSSTRFAVLGGAAQNSQLASDMVTVQIEERAGFRTSTASRMTTGNGEAGSLWVNPLYNKNRSGHLNAGHYTYGLDADLYGMSFGGDVAVNDTFRIGVAFSGGKGNSDAVGGLMPTKNDFDFYSGSLYAITDIGSVTLLTDLDYTWLKGDVKQTNRITTLNSTLKSDVTSFGVSAKRTFEVNNGTLVAPYAGVRVNRLHINGYDVKDTDGNTIITAESQQQYYATVPVGVQVSKNIELTNGFVKPVLDLGLVTTLGSRHMESRVTYTGFGETSATSEVRDRTAFTVKFGVNAEVGNLGLGLGYGLTGSQSLTSNQVYGNVRYRF